MGGRSDFVITGSVITHNKNHYILNIEKHNEKEITKHTAVLDVYIFEEKILTDDSHGITNFMLSSHIVGFNEYFDCVVCLNQNVPFWFKTEKKLLDDLKDITNTKLLKRSNEEIEQSKWEYQFNNECQKIIKTNRHDYKTNQLS